MLRGFEPVVNLPKLQPRRAHPRRPLDVRVRHLLRHRVDLAAPSRCSRAPSSAPSAARTLSSSVAVFVAYALGHDARAASCLTVSLGMARQGLLRRLRQRAALRHPGLGRAARASPGLPRALRLVRAPRASRRRRRRLARRSTWSPDWSGDISDWVNDVGADPARPAAGPRPGRRAHRHLRPARPAALAVGRFAELLAHDGVEEDLELRSPFGFMAFHGGNLEEGTDVDRRARPPRQPAPRSTRCASPSGCAGTSRRSRSAPRTPRRWPRSSTTSTSPSRPRLRARRACGPRSCSAAATAPSPPTSAAHLRDGDARLRGGRRPRAASRPSCAACTVATR